MSSEKVLEMPTETCVGCDNTIKRQPWVVISRGDPTSADQNDTAVPFGHYPVCNECHVNPEHRKRPLKGHFFPRAGRSDAVQHAGSSSIQG